MTIKISEQEALINDPAFLIKPTTPDQAKVFATKLLGYLSQEPSLYLLGLLNKALDKKYLFRKVGYSLKSYYSGQLALILSQEELDKAVAFLSSKKPTSEQYLYLEALLERAADIMPEMLVYR